MDSSLSEFNHLYCCKKGFQSKISNRMANSVDPDEMAHYKPSHLDLHCLQRYLYNLVCRDKTVKKEESQINLYHSWLNEIQQTRNWRFFSYFFPENRI